MDPQVIVPILLSWAVNISGYPAPDNPPLIQFEPHSFFVENVCGGRECTAVGWYNDKEIVYIDEKYQYDDGTFSTSLLVHELTHYLQHLSGNFDSHSCTDSLAREREAYRVQNEYIVTGQASFRTIKPGPTTCNYAFNAAITE